MTDTFSKQVTGTLAGIRVIDLTNVYSGPIAASILGDQGADVIKVEAPSGDMQRGPFRFVRNGLDGQFAMNNRNKRSIVVDLTREEGKSVLRSLIRDADVLMENYRPDVMTKFGFSFEEVHKLNPKLVYASINGYGSEGPYAGQRVYDAVIQAASGIATLQADRESGRPQMINSLICDKLTSLTAAQSICSALLAQERHGIGQHVQVAMIDAALYFMWPDGMGNEHFLPDAELGDVARFPDGNHAHMLKETSDGYLATMPVQPREIAALVKAMGITEALGDDGMLLPPDQRAHLNLGSLINEGFKAMTTEEACRVLEENQVPYGRIDPRDHVLDNPQIQAMGSIVQFQHPQGGAMQQPRPPAQFSETPSGIHRCSPRLGEHTDEILAEVGLSEREISQLREAGAIA